MSAKILYISQEIFPYVDESEIAKVSRLLPEFIQQHKYEVRLFMPKYGTINERRNQLHEVIRLSGSNISIDDRDHPLFIKVASIQSARMQVYFINNEDFFKRKQDFRLVKGTNDNDERSIFFVRGSLETVKKLRWVPDIIHCHGAFAALGMVYLRKVYHDDPTFEGSKLVVSLYNESDPMTMTDKLFKCLAFDGITAEDCQVMAGETDYKALMRLAIEYADAIVEGSADVDPELVRLAQASGKPYMPYPGDEHPAEAYHNFYSTL